MTAKQDVFRMLETLGIQHDDTVLIHTSLRAIGKLDGDADMLIDAFREYLSDGLFLVPTHTWDNVTSENPHYDVKSTIPCIGTLPCVAVKRGDGLRSLHPTHSVMAFGKNAADYIKGEECCASPAPAGGCWARLYDEKAKILLIGVGLDKNTYFHAVDEILHIPNRLNQKSFVITIRDAEGKELCSPPFHTHFTAGAPCCCSDFYPNYKKPLDALGALSYTVLGNAEVCCCDAVKSADIIRLLWERTERDLCTGNYDIPEQLYEK